MDNRVAGVKTDKSGVASPVVRKVRDKQETYHLVAEMSTNIDAFGELYRLYQPRIYGYVISRVGNRSDAEDITEQTFEKALRNADNFDPTRAKFFTWLYHIANNAINDYLRRKKKIMVEKKDAEEMFNHGSNTVTDKIDAYVAMMELVYQLHKNYQEVLVLKFFEGLGLDDMSEILGCTKKCISTRLYRALKALGKVMEKRKILVDLFEGGIHA